MFKTLFILAGDTSFDDVLFLDAFINQLPEKEFENCLLSPPLPLSQIRLKNDAIRIEVGTRAMTRESWQELLHDFQPQVAILCDPSVLLSPMAQAASYFDLDWLQDLPCALSVFDFRANLLKTAEGSLALKQYVLESLQPPAVLDYDFLIKVCPPHDVTPTSNPHLMHWLSQDVMPQLSVFAVKDETRERLGVGPEGKIITLIFPFENLIMSASRDLALHFQLVTDVLISYLNQIHGIFHLYIVNMTPPNTETRYDNVQVRYFENLDMELLDALLRASDLFVTESLTHPLLVQSALRGIPSLCLGSSVGLDAQGQLRADFESFSPLIQLKLDLLKAEAPQVLFPYLSFPIPTRQAWPGRTLFHKRYFFYLVDLCHEKEMVETLRDCLNGGPLRDQFFEQLQAYRVRKLEGTRDAEQIIRRLSTAPPRYL